MSRKVVIAGPSNSGKSTFTAALIESLKNRLGSRFDEHVEYVPLDQWDQSLPWLLKDTGASQRKGSSGSVSEEDIMSARREFEESDAAIVIADAPGKIDDALKTLIEPADDMIILSQDGKVDQIPDWVDVADELNITVLFEFRSMLDEDQEAEWDRISGEGVLVGLYRDEFRAGGLHNLDPTTRRVIQTVGRSMLSDLS